MVLSGLLLLSSALSFSSPGTSSSAASRLDTARAPVSMVSIDATLMAAPLPELLPAGETSDARGRFRKASQGLRHGSLVPAPVSQLVGLRNRQVLSFVLGYLERTPGLDGVTVYASGGFVRDLLLGIPSDDLDLALDLRTCAAGVTVDTLVAGMAAYATTWADDAVDSVEVVTHRVQPQALNCQSHERCGGCYGCSHGRFAPWACLTMPAATAAGSTSRDRRPAPQPVSLSRIAQ